MQDRGHGEEDSLYGLLHCRDHNLPQYRNFKQSFRAQVKLYKHFDGTGRKRNWCQDGTGIKTKRLVSNEFATSHDSEEFQSQLTVVRTLWAFDFFFLEECRLSSLF